MANFMNPNISVSEYQFDPRAALRDVNVADNEAFTEARDTARKIANVKADNVSSLRKADTAIANLYNNTDTESVGGPLAHEANNIVPSGKATTTEDLKLRLDFRPNILDSFDSAIYHWKLYIATPEASSNGKVFDTAVQTIIAESGVTDITIDNVEMSAITTPSIESGTGTMTNIRFNVIEPNGAALIDQLYYQSVALGIGTWVNMPMYMELKFNARNPNTGEPDNGTPGELNGKTWFWPIKVTSIKVNVSEVGARYEFVAVRYNEFAQSNLVFSVQQNVALENVDTFGNAMIELEEKLNSAQDLNLVGNYSIPDTYRIIVDKKLVELQITPADKNINSRRNDNFVKWGDKSATFQTSTGVDKIIDTLLSNTKEYQKSLEGSATAGGEAETLRDLTGQIKKFWKIVTETRPIRFDAKRQDIAKEFTIFIVEYDIGVLDSSVAQVSAGDLSLEAERKRLATYIKKSILKKQYNYIFTGLNDQVIDFDLTINNAYTVAQARSGGVVQTAALHDMGVVAQQAAVEQANAAQAVSSVIALANNAKSPDPEKYGEAILVAQRSLESNQLNAADKSRLNKLLDVYLPTAKPLDKTLYLIQARTLGINRDGSIADPRKNAVNLARTVRERTTNQQFNFISNVDPTSPKSLQAYAEYVQQTKANLRPIARAVSMQDRQVGLGVEGNSDSGLQKLSSMFSVALHSGMDNSFQTIKITIKGDPFWLFPGPIGDKSVPTFNSVLFGISPDQAINNIKTAHFNLVDSANYYGTDNFILVRFRSPRMFNIEENTDSTNPNADVETLSGIFKVTRVDSKFEGGKFTQVISAILDPVLKILDINKQIEESIKAGNKPTTVEELDKKLPLPPPAIKEQRIMGALDSFPPGIVPRTAFTIPNMPVPTGLNITASLSNIPEPINNLFGLPKTFLG